MLKNVCATFRLNHTNLTHTRTSCGVIAHTCIIEYFVFQFHVYVIFLLRIFIYSLYESTRLKANCCIM